MITREQAARLHANAVWRYDGDAVVNQHGDVVATGVRIDEEGALIEAAPDLARTVVALHDEVEHLRHDLHRYGLKTVGRLEEPLSDRLTAERDAARAEVATLTTRLRLAEASVSLLRGDVDHARLEIRRLRAADAPGTDDEAVAPWMPGHSVTATWIHPNGARVYRDTRFWYVYEEPGMYCHALDAMRAAVPGSL